MESLKGMLLVAAPVLEDPNFRRSVILLLEHTEEGAVGVVLNRPAEVRASTALPTHAQLLDGDDPVFSGGPVQPTAAVAVAEFADPLTVSSPVVGTIGVADLERDPDELESEVDRVRLYAGYAGWGPGQLEAELAEEAWFTEPALPGDVFTAEPDVLWTRVLERKGGRYRLIARMPDDPSLN
jgi:putative transcriptional regulator